VKLAMAFGGSAMITVTYIAGLVAAVLAFGGGPSVVAIGAVYLGASAVAAASGSPGGLGAFEAALIAALAGLGMRPAAAFAAVIMYRLSTYWLPVAPGWAAFQYLQRRGLI
jgi:glycosyltransferase 2 family protein